MNASNCLSAASAPFRVVAVTAILSVALLFSGCSSLETISPKGLANLTGVVRVGDRAECTLTDGSHLHFTVTAVGTDALVGGLRLVPAEDIARLEVERFDAGKTTTLVAVGVITGLGLTALGLDAAANSVPVRLGDI